MPSMRHSRAITEPEPAPVERSWSLGKRIGFRFVFAYLLLYLFPFPAGWVPGTDWLVNAVNKFWVALVPWFGNQVLHLATPIRHVANSSSTDASYDYVQLLCT